jgi:hypothetical protein
MKGRAQIYVALPDEGVDVWRPVEAENLHDDVYLIVSQPYDRKIERWQFEPGDRVRVQLVDSSDGSILAATGKVS